VAKNIEKWARLGTPETEVLLLQFHYINKAFWDRAWRKWHIPSFSIKQILVSLVLHVL